MRFWAWSVVRSAHSNGSAESPTRLARRDLMLSVPPGADDDFVYVPARLDERYLEAILSRSLQREVTIGACECTNLCAVQHGGVSNSGATMLRLALELVGGQVEASFGGGRPEIPVVPLRLTLETAVHDFREVGGERATTW